MFDSTKFDSLRSLAIGAIAALALSACGDDGKPKTTTAAGSSDYVRATDHVMGSADAPVTLTEYASVSCGACANWHNTVYGDLKKKYIDTGKVRYVFREFIAGPPELADAGFMIALCADEDKYFKNIELQFKRQKQIFDMVGKGQARDAYLGLSKASGLSEDDFGTCLQNEELRQQYKATMQTGVDMGIGGTPQFLVNGEWIERAPSGGQFYTLESMEEVILPLLGETVPEKTEEIAE